MIEPATKSLRDYARLVPEILTEMRPTNTHHRSYALHRAFFVLLE